MWLSSLGHTGLVTLHPLGAPFPSVGDQKRLKLSPTPRCVAPPTSARRKLQLQYLLRCSINHGPFAKAVVNKVCIGASLCRIRREKKVKRQFNQHFFKNAVPHLGDTRFVVRCAVFVRLVEILTSARLQQKKTPTL